MIIGSNIIFFKDLESTNDFAAGLLKKGSPPEGTVIHTNWQSAGKGQKGNKWESESGKNLLLSVILYPEMISPTTQFYISMVISNGISDFLRNFINNCSIKWPNDIYAGHDKIAGMLVENSIIEEKIESSIVGIGLNINQVDFPENLPNPVSLKKLTGRDLDTETCLKQLLEKLDCWYKRLIAGKTDEIRREYIASIYKIGEWSDFSTVRGDLFARIVSVTDSGLLQVEDKYMNLHEFSFKEIEFMP